MTGRDDLILDFLAEKDVILNKRGLEINLKNEGYDISYSTIKRRLPKLEEAGLIQIIREKGPYYAITEKGEAYLEGEADLRDLDEPE
ncbi:winged-helix domain-containing protein [Halapricum desulfuricans]|uniref:Transcriptional regulator, MarR family n=1 Tax=Halapricum desulfuricans TaxID=2841257 RepID=A0A897MXZ0_9EURY|nr:winged-helix domain-containing protein [Halapricum desulfuricans]QSG05324.1 Transcriptional regulator, MarR family [Halapricum desulfuricans]